jgi:hypothetical protein
VEQQVPGLEYSFDVAFDESQVSEEAEVGMITVSNNPIPQVTINEEHCTTDSKLQAIAPSSESEPAAAESEFKTRKNIASQQKSRKFPPGAYFYESGTTPDHARTIRPKKENFPISVNQLSSQNEQWKSDFQIRKAERTRAVSLWTPVNILFWLTMVISYLRLFIVLLIRQVKDTTSFTYNFARGKTRKTFVSHNKQVQTMSTPTSYSELLCLESNRPLENVSSDTPNQISFSFVNHNITPADIDERINLIARVNEAHCGASNAREDAREISTVITSPSVRRFSPRVLDGVQMEHGVLLNASMVLISSDFGPPPFFRGNMMFQFFSSPDSLPQAEMTPSVPNTPPPSRNSVRSPSPLPAEKSSSIFNTSAPGTCKTSHKQQLCGTVAGNNASDSTDECLEAMQILADMLGVDVSESPTPSEVEEWKFMKESWRRNQGLKAAKIDEDSSSDGSSDSSSDACISDNEALHEEVETASRYPSVSKKFPNLLAESIPTSSPIASTSGTTLPAENLEIYDNNRADVPTAKIVTSSVVSDEIPSRTSPPDVYQVLAAVVDPLPPSEPPFHPHHRPIQIYRKQDSQSTIYSKKLVPIVIPPFKPSEDIMRGRREARESFEYSPTRKPGGESDVQAKHSFFPLVSDSNIRQEVHPGFAILVSGTSSPASEKTDYNGEPVNPSIGASVALGLTPTPDDNILELGNSIPTTICSHPMSGLHLLAHAASVVEQQGRDIGSYEPTTVPAVESAEDHTTDFLSSMQSTVTSSTMKKLISAMSDSSQGLEHSPTSVGEENQGGTEPGVYPRILTTIVESEEENQAIPPQTPLGDLEYLHTPSQLYESYSEVPSGDYLTVTEPVQEPTPLVEPLPLRLLIHEELLADSSGTSTPHEAPSVTDTKSAIIISTQQSMPHENTVYYPDRVYGSVHSLKRRRDETEELGETFSNDGDISNHSPLADELGRIKRPRSEASTSNASQEQAFHDAWEIAITAALEAERSYSPTSSMSTDIEADWEEFQRELRESSISSSSFSQSSPPPLISVSDSESEEEIQIFSLQNKSLPGNTISSSPAWPSVASSPKVPATNIPPPIHPYFLPLDKEWYELKTDQPDTHGYSSAALFALRAHGYEITPDIPSSELPVPLGHPLWCLTNQYPILSMTTSKVYTGSDDNHPLVSWDNKILPYVPNADLTHGKFHEMAIPFIQASDILSTHRVCPEDWEGIPNTEYRREARHRVWNAHMMQPGSHLFKNPFPAEPPHLLGQLHTFFGQQPSMLSHNYRTVADNPNTWRDRPIGAEPGSDLALRFACPYANEYDIVAFNAWNPCIAKLREARAYILEGIKLIVTYLLNPRMRQLIDIYEDDLKHYFYHHCHLFRFIDPKKPPFMQGFTFECIHLDDYTIEYPPPPRKAQPTCNPLLSEEEDEFLHHVSRIFENLGKVELTNAIRQVWAVIPFMAEEARILFKAGYIDLLDQFDHRQVKYPLLWVTPEVRL